MIKNTLTVRKIQHKRKKAIVIDVNVAHKFFAHDDTGITMVLTLKTAMSLRKKLEKALL